MKCFIDMDGVLVDCIGGVHKKFGLPYDESENYPYTPGEWECLPPAGLDMTPGEFWDSLDEDFWSNLEWTNEGESILNTAVDMFGDASVCILTSPTLHPGSVIGKMKWINRHLPEYANQCLMGRAKYMCAHKDTVLIDDANHNVVEFMAHGGSGVLVPRMWNSRFKLTPKCLEMTIRGIHWAYEDLCKEL